MVDARVCHSTIVIHRPLQELEESNCDDEKSFQFCGVSSNNAGIILHSQNS
jgi:hypothetical protein